MKGERKMWSYRITVSDEPPLYCISSFESETPKGAFDLHVSFWKSLGVNTNEDKIYMWRRKISGSRVTIVLTEWESCYPFGVKAGEYDRDCRIDFNTCNFTIPEILQGA
jgi:hypothetical protein